MVVELGKPERRGLLLPTLQRVKASLEPINHLHFAGGGSEALHQVGAHLPTWAAACRKGVFQCGLGKLPGPIILLALHQGLL